MKSSRETETEISMDIQKTLFSINDVTLKIKKELEVIEQLLKENGRLHTVTNTANQVLSEKAQEMGMNVAEIISKNDSTNRLEADITQAASLSMVITEKLLKQIDA